MLITIIALTVILTNMYFTRKFSDPNYHYYDSTDYDQR